MRSCTLLCMGLFVCAASADPASGTLELWLSTSSNVTTFPAPSNPVLPVGYTGKVYLYARTPGVWQNVSTHYADNNGVLHSWQYVDWVGDQWNGISLNSSTMISFGGTIINPAVNGMKRWHTQADFTWSNNDQFNVGAFVGYTERGVGMAVPPSPPGTPGASAFDNQQACTVAAVPGNSGALYTYMGSVTISSAPANATLFMKVGTGSIARHNGNGATDLVRLGVGDAPVLARQIGAMSSLPDLTVIPEPGGVALLGVAVLSLRRR